MCSLSCYSHYSFHVEIIIPIVILTGKRNSDSPESPNKVFIVDTNSVQSRDKIDTDAKNNTDDPNNVDIGTEIDTLSTNNDVSVRPNHTHESVEPVNDVMNAAVLSESGIGTEIDTLSTNDAASNQIDILNTNETNTNAAVDTSNADATSAIDFNVLKGTVAEYRIVPGGKKNTTLLYNRVDKYLYKFNKMNAAGEKAYTCRHNSCKARNFLRQRENDSDEWECVFSDNYTGHDHPNDAIEVEKLELMDSVKKLCAQVPSASTGSVKDAYYAVMNTDNAKRVGLTFNSVSRNLYQIRNAVFPKSPLNAIEVNERFKDEKTLNDYGFTTRENVDHKTPFFRHAEQTKDYEYCIFASKEVIDNILEHIEPENRTYYIDGTFKVTPLGVFVQVLIISIDFMGQVMIVALISYFSYNFGIFNTLPQF